MCRALCKLEVWMIENVLCYVPVKVNPRGVPPRTTTKLWQGYVWPYRGLWQQQLFPISLWHHSHITNGRNIDLLGGDSDSNSSWQGEDSDRQAVSPSEFLGSALWMPPPQDSLWRVHYDLIMFKLFYLTQTITEKISWYKGCIWIPVRVEMLEIGRNF